MDVVVKFRSEPDVPTLPSIQKVADASTTRNQVAVPVAFALESCVIALAVRTPDDAPAAEVVLNVNSARRVVAAPPEAGRDPS